MKWSAAPPLVTSPPISAFHSIPATVSPAPACKPGSPSFPSIPSSTLASTPSSPAASSHNDRKVLECFAGGCARIRQAAVELSQPKPDPTVVRPELVLPESVLPESILPESVAPEFMPPHFVAASVEPASRPRYEAWTLVLGTLAILATIAVSVLFGSRIGWLRPNPSQAQISQPANSIPAEPIRSAATRSAATKSTPAAPAKSAAPAVDELVVYEKSKVIFRMKTAPAKSHQGKRRQP